MHPRGAHSVLFDSTSKFACHPIAFLLPSSQNREVGKKWNMNDGIDSYRLFAIAIVGWVSVASAQENASVLEQVEQQVRSALGDRISEATFEYPGSSRSLLVLYRPQKFLIHPGSKSGERSTNVFEQTGPSFTGFVLRVHTQELGTINQAVTPQVIREPYWQTYLDIAPVNETTNQLYWALSYYLLVLFIPNTPRSR